MVYKYLTMQQVDVLLKCYYLKRATIVAKIDNIKVGKIKWIKEKALRVIRLAYSNLRLNGLEFNGELVIQHMSENSGLTPKELTRLIDLYILAGLESESRMYWRRIRKTGEVPTAKELLEFLYDKYEVEIEGDIRVD